MQIATRWTLLWTKRGFQIARPGDWLVVAPTGCTWRIKKKHHKFYIVTHKLTFNLCSKPTSPQDKDNAKT